MNNSISSQALEKIFSELIDKEAATADQAGRPKSDESMTRFSGISHSRHS